MKVMTRYGWLPLNGIGLGDRVIGGADVRQEHLTGSEVVITNITTKKDELYLMNIGEGSRRIECHLSSKFQVRGGLYKEWTVITLDELLSWFPLVIDPHYCACKSEPYLNAYYEIRQALYYIPFSNIPLDSIPAYWIGVFATKGCLEGPEPYLYLNEEEAQRIRDQGSWDFILQEPYSTTPGKYFFRSYTYINERSKLSIELENLGLLGVAIENRDIHDSYVYTDFRDRVNLIQGVMDSVGYIDPIDNKPKARVLSKSLANKLAFIVRTIGGLCKVTYDDLVREYILEVAMPYPEVPFSRPSLAARYVEYRPVLKPLYIESITKKGIKGELTVLENMEGLPYISDDFLITY
jgi:hypothetical protein